ncbi:MAG: hypothetical protein CMK59_10270 [Proteobacteria bacterium]|nr:hypothetical protein [Pseudomonadota bacterium]
MKRKPLNTNIKQIYIHAGLHRTATTSVQRTLFHGIDYLTTIGEGYWYPLSWCLGVGRNQGVVVISMFSKKSDRYQFHSVANRSKEEIRAFNKDKLAGFIKEAKATKATTLVLSGEDIASPFFEHDELNMFKKFLEQSFPNASITIILSLRENVKLLVSEMQHRAKMGVPVDPERIVSVAERVYFSRLKSVRKVFKQDQIVLFKFEDACKDPFGPVGYLLRKMGIPEDALPNFDYTHANESISDKSVEIVEYISEVYPLNVDEQVSKGRYSTDTFVFNSLSGGKYMFKQPLLGRVEANAQIDKRWLYEHFGVDYLKSGSISKTEDQKESFTYDELYYREMLFALRQASGLIQYISYQFFQEKLSTELDERSKTIFEQLLSAMELRFPEVVQHDDIEDLLKQNDETIRTSVFNQSHMFNRMGLSTSIHPADFYSELAFMCEKNNQFEAALHFMKTARLHRLDDLNAIEKCEEYIQILNPKT